ncbi:MAG: hypothetical protein M3O30_01390 [Planctomycetota bacterium]|nr:hypothetical protein [Planctomycetota bacterium]
MAFFGFGKRSQSEPVAESLAAAPVVVSAPPPPAGRTIVPSNLSQQLFKAARLAADGDDAELRRLCKRHQRSIHAQGLLSGSIPSAIRANPTLLRWYRDGLASIAAMCPAAAPSLIGQVPAVRNFPQPKPVPKTDLSDNYRSVRA